MIKKSNRYIGEIFEGDILRTIIKDLLNGYPAGGCIVMPGTIGRNANPNPNWINVYVDMNNYIIRIEKFINGKLVK